MKTSQNIHFTSDEKENAQKRREDDIFLNGAITGIFIGFIIAIGFLKYFA
jgi:hypothetical protein